MGAKIQIVICIRLRNDGPKQFETYSGEKKHCKKAFDYVQPYASFLRL